MWTRKVHTIGSLKDGFLTVVVAFGTKPMLRLAKCLGWIERVHKCSNRNLLKRVTGTLLFPCLVMCEFLLQVFICTQRLLILRLNRRHLGLKVEDGSLKLYRHLFDFSLGVCFQKALGDIGYGGECGVRGGEVDHREGYSRSLQTNSEIHAPRDTGQDEPKNTAFVVGCSNITRRGYSHINAPRISRYQPGCMASICSLSPGRLLGDFRQFNW